MIDHAAWTLNSPLKTMEALYSCFILVGNHQQCTSTEPPRGLEPGVNDCESNTLTTRLSGLALNGLLNIYTT